MALTFAADAEVFLDINVHNNNIFFVFLDFVRLSLAVAAASVLLKWSIWLLTEMDHFGKTRKLGGMFEYPNKTNEHTD